MSNPRVFGDLRRKMLDGLYVDRPRGRPRGRAIGSNWERKQARMSQRAAVMRARNMQKRTGISNAVGRDAR